MGELEGWQIVIGSAFAAGGGGAITGAVLKTEIRHLIETVQRIERALTRAHVRIDRLQERMTVIEVIQGGRMTRPAYNEGVNNDDG